jgi:hypothetical protein
MERMTKVMKYLQDLDDRVASNSQMFENIGEERSTGDESDDSAKWRVVEVHIFDKDPPPDPTKEEVKPSDLLPLPGGPRYKKWGIATPGSVTIAEGIGTQLNVIIIKNEVTGEKRGFLNILVGAGASASIPGGSALFKILQVKLTGISASAVTFTSVTAKFPMTWAEMEKAGVAVTGDTELIKSNAHFFFSTGMMHYGPNGMLVHEGVSVFDFVASGFGLGAGVFAGTGDLKRVEALDRLGN